MPASAFTGSRSKACLWSTRRRPRGWRLFYGPAICLFIETKPKSAILKNRSTSTVYFVPRHCFCDNLRQCRNKNNSLPMRYPASPLVTRNSNPQRNKNPNDSRSKIRTGSERMIQPNRSRSEEQDTGDNERAHHYEHLAPSQTITFGVDQFHMLLVGRQ